MKRYACLTVLALLFGVSTARANDQIASTVTNAAAGPQAVIVNNGVPSGTIQLWYTHVGESYPCGPFAQFNLSMEDTRGNGTAPAYPVKLDLVQSGEGTPVQLSSDPSSLSVSGVGWSGSSVVTVSIDCSKLPAPYDGQDIVGNLNQGTDPSGAHLGTISTVQVHIKLSIPTGPCLKLYSFESDQGTGVLLGSITVVAKKSGDVTSTNPGQVSVDAMVVNQCAEEQSFGLKIGLDDNWRTKANGNGMFTYTYAGETEPTEYNMGMFGAGTPAGFDVCLSSVTLQAGESFLARLHSDIKEGLTVSGLPADGFVFSAGLYTDGGNCAALLPTSIVSPNPATSSLSFTLGGAAASLVAK